MLAAWADAAVYGGWAAVFLKLNTAAYRLNQLAGFDSNNIGEWFFINRLTNFAVTNKANKRRARNFQLGVAARAVCGDESVWHILVFQWLIGLHQMRRLGWALGELQGITVELDSAVFLTGPHMKAGCKLKWSGELIGHHAHHAF